MGDRRSENALHDLDALFRLGVVSGMTDGELLERFMAQSDGEGQLAFEAIVRRHGPMVLGVCLRALGNHHAAEDAFQATFMVLAVKSRAIRKQESLGPWLHGVAARIARRKVVVSRRGKSRPIPVNGLLDPLQHDPESADVNTVLDEELGRLPDKYRLPVVLCYLEGQTQDEAARTLGWTKGTVSGRLARAKDLLRHRLTRRGLAPTAGAVAACLTTQAARAALPTTLVQPTVRAGMSALLGGTELGLVAGPAASLARQTLKGMFLGRISRAAAQILVLGLGAAALATPIFLPGPRPLTTNKSALPATTTRRVAGQVDRFGDPMPAHAIKRLGTIQRRHTRGVAGLDFTRDGRSVVSAQNDGIVRVWDPETGRQVRTIDVMADTTIHDKSLRDLAISPDGALIAAAGFAHDPARRRIVHRVWIWDLKRDRPRSRIEVPTVDLFCVAFSPDGRALATGGFGGDVRLWDVATGDCLETLKLGASSIHSVSFTPDGKILAACEERKGARLYDLEQNRQTFLADPRSTPLAPVFSGDGRWMALSALGGEAIVWNRITGRRHLTARGRAVTFSQDSRTLALLKAESGSLEVIDVEDGGVLWKIDLGRSATPVVIAFSPDGKAIVTETGGTLRFFEAGSGRERFGIADAHQGGVAVVKYLPDGRTILTAGDDGTVRQWDAATARQLRVFPHDGRVAVLAVSADGARLASAVQGPRGSVSVWDLATGERRLQWPETEGMGGPHALAFSSAGDTLMELNEDHKLIIRDIMTGDEREVQQPGLSLEPSVVLDPWMTRGVFSSGNQFLAVTTSSTATVADLATGEERLATPCQALAFTSGGRGLLIAVPGKPEMTALADGSLRTMGPTADGIDLVDLDAGRRSRIANHRGSVTALAVSPDGKVAAVAGGYAKPMIWLYRMADGAELGSFACPARVNEAAALAFSPDGRSLAAGLADTTVVIWDMRDVR